MQEKTKRKNRQSSWKFTVLLTLLIILVAAISSPFIYSSFAPSPYATEPWTDPRMICTTFWFHFEVNEDYVEAFRESLAETDLPLVLRSVDGTNSRGVCPDGDGYSEITLSFEIEETLLDNAVLGDFVAELMPLVAESPMGAPSVINFWFVLSESEFGLWRIDFAEGQRALAAGLRGADLWLVGQSSR